MSHRRALSAVAKLSPLTTRSCIFSYSQIYGSMGSGAPSQLDRAVCRLLHVSEVVAGDCGTSDKIARSSLYLPRSILSG